MSVFAEEMFSLHYLIERRACERHTLFVCVLTRSDGEVDMEELLKGEVRRSRICAQELIICGI